MNVKTKANHPLLNTDYHTNNKHSKILFLSKNIKNKKFSDYKKTPQMLGITFGVKFSLFCF